MAVGAHFRGLILRVRRAAVRSPERSDHWLPEFCSASQIAMFVLLAEAVYLIVFLAPTSRADWSLSRLVAGTSFVTWIALISVVALCKLRPWLVERDEMAAVVGAWLVVPTTTLIASMSLIPLAPSLSLLLPEAAMPSAHLGRFVAGNTLIALLASSVLFRYLYVSDARRQNERGQARAEVIALQARIRPHFLFNSMNTIASLIPLRPRDAERAIEDLAELFRAALAPGERLSTLGDELELVRRYLEIERLRLGDRLRVRWSVDGLPDGTPMPALLLQPLVENAVHHGVSALPAGGLIEIEGTADSASVMLRIANPRPARAQAVRAGHGIALDNVRQRLAYHYGDAARLLVHDAEGSYTCEVMVPR